MKNMKILIVGLGSMGKRRLRLIQKNYPEFSISGVEFSEERREDVSKTDHIKCYDSISKALNASEFEAAFVCTPPAKHHEVTKELLEDKINVFTELNLINNGYDELLDIAGKNNVQIFMSSTLLYRKEIQKIIELVSAQKQPLQYIYHVGQYLPDWHPWESYKNFFVGNNETNGCREIFAIQLPWILKCFGKSVSIGYTSRQKISDLDLDYPDSYILTLEHKSGNRGVIIIDVVARKATTSLEIVGENLHLFWDGTPTSLRKYDIDAKSIENITLYDSFEHNQNYAPNIIEDSYLAEIECFFNMLLGKGAPLYTLTDDKKTLELIDIIEGRVSDL